MEKSKRKSFFRKGISLWVFFLFLSFFSFVEAQGSASLYLTPASGTYQTGQTFSVSVLVKSEQETMNAAEATLKFDPSIIRVKSISKVGSIFSFWPQEPTFSNTAGTIKFAGGTPTSYKGSRGKIITIYFRAQREGKATLSFTSGRIASTGLDITGNLKGASFTIVVSAQPPPETQIPTGAPSAPKITSPTHPHPQKWYNNNSPKFEWEVPSAILAVKLAYGRHPNLVPIVLYEPPISSKQLEDIKDGVWYFAAQFKNDQGWGKISRFKFQIDTLPPKAFTVSVDNQGDSTNPTPIFKFETEDEVSGIDFYEIILNNQSFAKVKPEELKEGTWQPSPLNPGSYVLEIKAFDKAGNFSSASTNFSITPLSLEISQIPSRIKEGQPLKIEGKTLPQITVNLFFQKRQEKPTLRQVKSDAEGHFKFEEILPIGKYFVWLQAQDQRGAKSLATEKYSVEVAPERFTFFFSIFLAILISIGLGIIFYLGRRIIKEKEKIKIEKIKKRKEKKLKAYTILKDSIKSQIDYLEEKVDLSRSETRILEVLKKALKEAEEVIKEELEK